MQNHPDHESIQEALRLAGTPAGQQLLALLQSQNGAALDQALAQAAAGDYSSVKATMEALLANEDAKNLLKQLRGDSNG